MRFVFKNIRLKYTQRFLFEYSSNEIRRFLSCNVKIKQVERNSHNTITGYCKSQSTKTSSCPT